MQPHTKSETDRVVAGVAGGIAQRLGVSSTLVRLAWVLPVFVGGLGIVAYLVLAVVLPKGSAHTPASRIAEERFARGEITAAELDRIRRDPQAASRRRFRSLPWLGSCGAQKSRADRLVLTR